MIKYVGKMKSILCTLFLFALLQSVYALEITSKAIEGYVQIEDSESFDYFGALAAVGELGLNDIYLLRGGFAYGRFEGSTDLKSFASATASPFSKIDFSLLWIYNGIFEYETHVHSVIPTATYKWKKTGLALGGNFRFTSFLGEEYIMEVVPAWKFYFNFLTTETLRLSFTWGNYNEFYARNLVGYSYDFTARIRLNSSFEVIYGIDLLQQGAVSFTESLYGFSIKTGVRYSW